MYERDKVRTYVWSIFAEYSGSSLGMHKQKMGCTFQRIPFYDDISNLSDLLQFAVAIFSRAAKLFLDADELVVLRNTVGTAHRTSLNLT